MHGTLTSRPLSNYQCKLFAHSYMISNMNNFQTNLFDLYMETSQIRLLSGLGSNGKKEYSTFSRFPKLESHSQMQFSLTLRTPFLCGRRKSYPSSDDIIDRAMKIKYFNNILTFFDSCVRRNKYKLILGENVGLVAPANIETQL